jgi:hypothetical protein
MLRELAAKLVLSGCEGTEPRKVRKKVTEFVGATPRGCPSDAVVISSGDNQRKSLREPQKYLTLVIRRARSLRK